jgi:thioredoxin-like negative regulator of GroEL
VEDQFLSSEADTVAYAGRLRNARDLTRRAVASAEHTDEKESAAYYEAEAALRESLFGEAAEARQRAVAALKLSTGRDVQFPVALALAMTGDTTWAQSIVDELAKQFPQDTWVQLN